MTSDDRSHQRQTEPSAAFVACAAVVEADPALEHALTVGIGDPGAVVVDRQDHEVAVADAGNDNVDACVPLGIGDDVVVCTSKGRAVRVDPHWLARDTKQTANVDALDALRGCRIEPSKEKKVLNEDCQPADVRGDARRNVAPVRLRRREREGDVELGLDGRERRAQLVRGIGNERALHLCCPMQPV